MAGIDGYTKLCLHCDGIDGSTSFPDASASSHTVTAIGDAQVDTAQKKFGTGSVLFDNTGDGLTIPDSDDWYVGTAPWTIDFQGYLNTLVQNDCLFSLFDDSGSNRFLFGIGTTNSVELYVDVGGTTVANFRTPNNSITTGTFHHIELARNGANFYIFIDGVSQSLTYTVTPDINTNFPNISSICRIGHQAFGWYVDGWLDEFRFSKGIARHTSNFTPPIKAYSLGAESISVDETLNLSDENVINIPIEVLNVLETLYLDDDNQIILPSFTINVNESLYLGENNDINIPTEVIEVLETLHLTDNNNIHVDENIDYGVRILSYNPLILLTGIDPVKLVYVDISTPASPDITVYTVTGITNAKDIVLNDTTDYFYLGGADGIIVKVEKADLSNQTIIDTSDTNDFQNLTVLENFARTFASTDDASGEIIMIDNATIDEINTDVRWSERITNIISCIINTILGEKINCDVRYSQKIDTTIITDIRWLKYDYTDLTQYSINYSDIQVKINGTDLAPLNDVDLKSIVITHTKEDYSTALFILHRKHDNPNYDNQGNASQITNQNTVQIYINGHLEFNGTIQSLTMNSESETINVNARMNEPTSNKQIRSIPLASVGEGLNPYHCLLNNIVIENPSLNTNAVIVNKNGLYWTGGEWVGDLDEAQTFASHASAQSTIDSNNILNKFPSQEVYPINYDDAPTYYKGIQVNLGTRVTQQVERRSSFESVGDLAKKIEKGTFNPKQNWTYFWFASFQNFITKTVRTSLSYLGNSLGSLSADTWKITGASYKYQRQLDDEETDLGFYYVGSAPFKSISTENGRFITKDRWVDKNDGLYRVKDESYNYEQYTKDVASLEYSKLKTIHNQILPVTNAQIDLTLDGYYFYNIKLLTRLNLTNTTASNIYNGNNGFSVAIKSITISTDSMKVSLQCDNQLCLEELQKIDRNYPDANSKEYIQSKQEKRNYRKFDPNVWGYID